MKISEDKWRKHFENWEVSGMSQAEYCRKHGLAEKRFYYWKRRLRGGGAKKSKFTPVATSESLELVIGSVTLKVPSNFDPKVLKRVVDALC